jgi:hypothetical protein
MAVTLKVTMTTSCKEIKMKIGFFGILGLVFIVLKLTEVVAWSWWIVLLPIYGGFIFTVVLLGILGVFFSKLR